MVWLKNRPGPGK